MQWTYFPPPPPRCPRSLSMFHYLRSSALYSAKIPKNSALSVASLFQRRYAVCTALPAICLSWLIFITCSAMRQTKNVKHHFKSWFMNISVRPIPKCTVVRTPQKIQLRPNLLIKCTCLNVKTVYYYVQIIHTTTT